MQIKNQRVCIVHDYLITPLEGAMVIIIMKLVLYLYIAHEMPFLISFSARI